jgi:membrane-bound ClpP family serine protease
MNQDENPQFSTSSERPRSSRFPRTPLLPTQSPKYWVKEKDRYLRQLLIQDIQDQTQRELVVYFTFNGMIEFPDADDLSEILNGCSTKEIDLLIQTPGGVIDACEKLISVLKQRVGSYRVLIPGWAKSAGTIIALASTEIVMGSDSELGPIDPQFSGIPAEYLKDDEAQPYHVRQIAESAINRTRKLAAQILNEGMMQGRHQTHIEELVNQLSSTQSYLSHGAVI